MSDKNGDVYIGYEKLKPDRIHLYCPGCGRKMSNMPRADYDPIKAHLCHVHCENCSVGHKDSSFDYLDQNGKFLDFSQS